MKGKKIPFWRIAAGLMVLAGLFVGIGYSSFVLDNYETIDTSCSTGIGPVNPDQQDDMVTVNFKYQTAQVQSFNEEPLGINYDGEDYSTDSLHNITDETSYNRLQNLINAVTNGDNDTSDLPANSTYTYAGKDDFDGCNIYLYVKDRIHRSIGFFKWNYSGSYRITKQKNPSFSLSTETDDSFSIKVPTGTVLKKELVSDYLEQNKSEYSFIGFKEENADLSVGELVSKDFEITKDSTFYILLEKKEDALLAQNNLSATINDLSDTTATFNAQSAVGAFNLANDLSYKDKSVYLTDETTIRNGVTVNFGLNNGSITENGGGGSNFEPNISNLQYKVVLQSDLTIDGTLVIGSKYGASASNASQGMISGAYVSLDLNGHNIFINDTGSLLSYGIIEDSVGTGCIYVKGGKLHTLASIQDYRGGTATTNMVGGLIGDNGTKEFPFEVYSLPYLRCHARLADGNNGIGQLLADAYICASSEKTETILGQTITIPAQIVETTLNFIGPESDTAFLFSIKSNSSSVDSSYVDVFGYTQTKMESDSDYSTSDKNAVLSKRTKIVLHNVSGDMNSIDIDLSVKTVSTGDYIFPISGFFDILLESSKLEFSSRIKFLPGSSFIADENSVIGLSSSNDCAAQISVLDKNYYYYDTENDEIIKNDNAGTAGSQGQTYLTSSTYAKYFSNARFKVYGTIAFKTGNDGSNDYKKKYILSGHIDFNKIATYSEDLNSLKIVDYSENENPFSKISDIQLSTYNFSTMLGSVDGSNTYFSKGFALPLISRGRFYADGLVGTWDEDTGAMKGDDGKNYIISCGDGNWDQDDDGSGCSLLEASYDSDKHVFSANGQYYVYFGGMYCQLDSYDASATTHTAVTKRLKTDNTTKVTYDGTRWLRA